MAASATIPVTEKSEPPAPSMHPAERRFNWLTYVGMAGVGGFIATLPITYSLKYTCANAFKRVAKSLETFGFSPKLADTVVTTTALMQGGNVATLGVMAMEAHKAELVEKLRKPNEPPITEAIKATPQPTFWGWIKTRILLAWLPVAACLHGANILLGNDASGKNNFAKFEEGFSKYVVCKPLGTPVTNAAGLETKTFKIGKLAALDIFAVASAAALLFVGKNVFAEKPVAAPAACATATNALVSPLEQSSLAPRLFTDSVQPVKKKPPTRPG